MCKKWSRYGSGLTGCILLSKLICNILGRLRTKKRHFLYQDRAGSTLPMGTITFIKVYPGVKFLFNAHFK